MIREDLTARQGTSRLKRKVDFGARDKSAEAEAVCEDPNDREHRP